MTDARPISDLVSAVIDYRGKTPPKTDKGIPLITAKIIKGGRIEPVQEYVSEETYQSWMRRGFPSWGDVLVTTEAPLGEVAEVPEDDRIALAQRVILLRPDPDKVDPQFFFHFLRSPEALSRLRQRSSGTTVAGIRQPELKAVLVDLLDRTSQEKVGRVLDDLDELIENLRRRVEQLEEMARAIYREWFVRFRYPGYEDVALVNSPLGPIPEGWSITPLGDIAELCRTNILPSRFADELFDHFSIPAFDDGRLPTIEPGDAIRSGKYLLDSPAVMISKLNPRIERTWFAQPGSERRSVTSTEFLILRPREGSSLAHLYLLARSDAFQDKLRELSGGTSTSHQRAKPTDFLALTVPCPPKPFVRELSDRVGDAIGLCGVLRRDRHVLVGLRDLLLPKLVSGAIDVSTLRVELAGATE